MSRAAAADWPPAVTGGRWKLAGLITLGSVATAAATVVGNGSILVAIAPLAIALGLAAIWAAPLRIPLFAVIFLSLALDATDEGPWNSPLASLGALLGHNLSKTIPGTGVPLQGITVILGALLLLHVHRRLSLTRTDDVGRTGTSPAMMWGLGLSFSAIVALCAVGLRNGGNIEMVKIQVQTFVLLLSMAYLLAVTMRGHRDHRTLAILIVAAACIKALLALYVSLTGRVLTNGDDPAFATTHGDSILFACAVVIMTVRFAETPIRRNAYLCLLILPLLTGGMMANNRRLVWVEIAVAAVAYCFITRRHLKKTFARAALVVVPLAIAYVAIGWNSQAEIFAPVQLFRSVGDGEVNRSTMYRDIENYNLLYTIRWNPLVGTGFGHPFSEIVPLDDISFFQEYRYMPHNSILGLWAYAGVFGYTGLSLALVIAVFLAARSYNLARKSDERVAAFSVIAMIVIYEIHCWGDIGFSERHSVFLVSAALAVAGQLAVSTGAWGTGQQHSRTRLADHVVG